MTSFTPPLLDCTVKRSIGVLAETCTMHVHDAGDHAERPSLQRGNYSRLNFTPLRIACVAVSSSGVVNETMKSKA